MRINVKRGLNVAYVHLQDEPNTVETKRLSENLLMDMGPDGTICGLELLNAREQLGSADLAELEVKNEDSGETTRMADKYSHLSPGATERAMEETFGS